MSTVFSQKREERQKTEKRHSERNFEEFIIEREYKRIIRIMGSGPSKPFEEEEEKDERNFSSSSSSFARRRSEENDENDDERDDDFEEKNTRRTWKPNDDDAKRRTLNTSAHQHGQSVRKDVFNIQRRKG